jgi:hypothetical protein
VTSHFPQSGVATLDVVEKAFNVVKELQEGKNEGDRNGDVKPPFDNKGQQPLRDVEHFRECA